MKACLLFVIALFSAAVFAQPAPAPATGHLPVEAFASLPNVRNVQLSPDGNNVVLLQSFNQNGLQIVVIRIVDLKSGESKFVMRTDNIKARINNVVWANNDQLLVNAAYPATRFGVPVYESRLIKIDVATNESQNIIPALYYKRLSRTPQFQTDVVDYLPDDDDHILLAMDGLHDHYGTSVLRINLKKGMPKVVQYGSKNIDSWVTDRQHNVRLAIFHEDTEFRVYEYKDGKKQDTPLWQFEAFSEDQVWPIGFSEDPNILFVSAYHQGKRAVFTVDLSSADRPLTLVYANPKYDISGDLLYSEVKKKVVGVSYGDHTGYGFFDEDLQAFQQAIDAALPDTTNTITSMSSDENRYIVFATSDTDAGVYLLGDRKDKSMTFLATRYDSLPPELMSPKKKIRYKSRDGLEIEGFLTLPLGYKPGDKLASIIFPHGGPISFDGGGFDYWTQFFANRGYAVLQMNFRGSAGYGFDFMQAGLQNWGLQMQDDVEDGTHWLINEGIADTSRICIVGASYGGYAALMAAVKNPKLYQCVASIAGVTDIKHLVRSSRFYSNYEIVKKQIGDDYKALAERSPVNHADKIQVPVLLIHGTKDRSVRVEHSRDMYDELKDENKDVKYVELEDGDHYLSHNQHRVTTFVELDAFLQRHLSLPAISSSPAATTAAAKTAAGN